MMSHARTIAIVTVAAASALLAPLVSAHSQDVHIRDLTVTDGSTPVRLLGYGIVVGLDGTGDRSMGGRNGGGGQTVQSIANILRHFNIDIPVDALRTRNAAAVLVTAEVSPYLHPGSHFDINVASLGDARSLRGGTLWMTPLVADANAPATASAQGSIVMSDGNVANRTVEPVETSGRIPGGGLLEGDLGHTSFASASHLFLKEPDIGTATKIVAAINQAIGANAAKVEDPGSIALTLPNTPDHATTLVKIQALSVTPDRPNRLIIDGRDGTVIAGGDIKVASAVISHSGVTLTIGSAADLAASSPPAGGTPPANQPSQYPEGGGLGTQGVSIQSGASVQKVASALQAVQMSPTEIAAIFESLREAGAISAEVTIR